MSLLKVNVGGLELDNPVMVASGTFGFGHEYGQFIDLNELGGISVKGLTLAPRQGNKPPRIAEVEYGILNSVGLQNPGVDSFIKNDIPFLQGYNTKIIANIAGNTIDEYKQMAEKLVGSGIHAIEVNVSCPNVKHGGAAFGTNCETLYQVAKGVKEAADVPVIIKLTPNVTSIVETATAAKEAGADAVSLINTLLGMRIDINTKRPILANNAGGMSGPAVKPVAIRMVNEVYRNVDIPIIGMGGISTWEDAIEFHLAGATAIMVGTANFVNPFVSVEIKRGIEKYLLDNGYKSVMDIVGKVELY